MDPKAGHRARFAVRALALVGCFYAAAAPAWGIVVLDDPNLHVVTAPSEFDGIAYLNTVEGSTAVLINPWYMVTAGHAAYVNSTETFYLSTGPEVYTIKEVFKHSSADIGVIRLNRSTAMTGYALYDANDEIGKTAVMVGYGMSGLPSTVQAGGDPNYPRGTLRVGYNRIDSTPYITGVGTCLQIDFDKTSQGGLGDPSEAAAAKGDSGAGMFIETGGSLRLAGVIASVYYNDPNHWPKTYNDSRRDLTRAVRVSTYRSWILDQLYDPNMGPGPESGDFNTDSVVNAVDIDALTAHYGGNDYWYDVSGDSVVNATDTAELIHSILSTEFGDANLDGRVDLDDYDLLAANFGLTGTAGWVKGDFNADKNVTFADYQILEMYFGFGTDGKGLMLPGVPVPEPASIALFACGAMLLTRRGRRQRF